MRAYIIEYRHFDAPTNSWISKISQEGYTSIEAAQDYIETRPGHMVQDSAMHYRTEGGCEYYIHDVRIIDAPAQPARCTVPFGGKVKKSDKTP